MIAAESLRKFYARKEVLRGLSLQARPGEITMLVGANGAGKSTTMKVLAGLVAADCGTALIAGHDIGAARRRAQRDLSYLPQNPDFHPRLSCWQVLDFYARLRGVDRERIPVVLEQAGLKHEAQERISTLSGGMRQRLGIALLLLPDAPVLLLDEPGLSLDPGWRNRLQQMLHEEAARGKTILMATHLIAEWNGVAHRCLLCHDGVITRELDPSDLPHDFDHFEDASPTSPPGGARASRAGFGVQPKRTSEPSTIAVSDAQKEKSAKARTPSPAREARSLPGMPIRR
ncbi:MAG: ABC transporter ATP-binding protein [Spartobacteria bacterium]